jgi:putative tryptophan/tyrosine transport system substrate-binding protein
VRSISFERLVQNRSAFLVDSDPLFTSRRAQLVVLSIRHGIPAIFTSREFEEAGGLIELWSEPQRCVPARLYWPHPQRRKARRVPVVQSTKFEFVINMQTARALGIEVPMLADEVIE